MADIPLHPSLRELGAKQHRLLLLMSMLLFLIISGGMIAMMAIAFSSGDVINLLLLGVIGLVMMPMVALLSWLLRYLDRWLSRQLERAGQLLRDSQPVAARLVPAGSASRAGVLVELHPLAAGKDSKKPIYALINPSFRWTRPPRREVMVQVYCREFIPDSDLVALQPGGGALLGRLVDRETYERRMRLLQIAALVLLGAVLAGILTFGGTGR